MKTKMLVALMMGFIMFAQTHVSVAQTANKSLDGWTLLGTRTVDYTLDRDVVSLKAGSEYFTALKFIVKNGTLNMHKSTVHFTNGDTENIEFSDEVSKYNDGRIMELKENSRPIEKVTFWYDSKNESKNKSIVELWGKK